LIATALSNRRNGTLPPRLSIAFFIGKKMKQLAQEKRMAVKEVAEIFGVTKEAIIKHIRDLYPEILTPKKKTYLSEAQVTEIKKRMKQTTEVVSAKTGLERASIVEQAVIILREDIETLKEQVNKKENQIKRLIHTGKLYTSTEIAKELNMKSAQELNKYLQEEGIQYKVNDTWVLTAKYSEMGYESIKQIERDNGKIIYDRKWTGTGRDFILDILE